MDPVVHYICDACKLVENVVQDSRLRTLTQANFSSSWSFAGGAYTVTATINNIDVLSFAWDNTRSKWRDQSRATNQQRQRPGPSGP